MTGASLRMIAAMPVKTVGACHPTRACFMGKRVLGNAALSQIRYAEDKRFIIFNARRQNA